jgi:hypothetical protein
LPEGFAIPSIMSIRLLIIRRMPTGRYGHVAPDDVDAPRIGRRACASIGDRRSCGPGQADRRVQRPYAHRRVAAGTKGVARAPGPA